MANALRGRSTPPTKTTRAEHTRKTTPTSPSWRLTNEPSRLVTFAAAATDRAVRASGAGRCVDGPLARFAVEALRNRADRGPTGHFGKQKQTKRNPEL